MTPDGTPRRCGYRIRLLVAFCTSLAPHVTIVSSVLAVTSCTCSATSLCDMSVRCYELGGKQTACHFSIGVLPTCDAETAVVIPSVCFCCREAISAS